MSRTLRLRAVRATVLAGAVLLAAPLGAQTGASEAPPRIVTLEEAIALALRNTPAAVQAIGLERNAIAARRQSIGAYAPTVNLSIGSGHTQGTTINSFTGQLTSLSGNPWSYSNGLNLSVDLFDGGRRWSEINRIRATADVADISAISARFDATLQVKQQYYAALAARESAAAAKAQLEQAEQQLKASSARVTAGVVTRSDSLRSVIQVGNAQLAVLTAENDLRVANAALTRVAGSTTPLAAAASDTLEAPASMPSESELLAMLPDGPAVKLAEANIAVARAAKKTQKSTYLPTLSMTYSYALNDNSRGFNGRNLMLLGGDNASRNTFNFSIGYTLFNGFTREANTVALDVTLTNAEASLRDARLAARQNLTTLLRTLQNAQARVSVQMAAIAAAEEDLRVQTQRYNLGASTLLDLLTSQTTLNQARQSLIQARFDGRVARAQLASLIGRPL